MLNKIKELREKKKLTQRQLADRIGVGLSTVTHWEQGKRYPNSICRKKLCEFFGVTEAFLFQGSFDVTELTLPVCKVPLISWIHANQFSTAEDPFPAGVSDTYAYSTWKGKNMFALKIKNDCMEPEFRENDVVIVDPSIEPRNNDFVVIKSLKSNEATFKQFKIYGEKIILHPLNSKYQDIELDHKQQYTVIGVVVDKSKKYR